MTYDMLVEKLRSARAIRSLNQYYASVARDVEQCILGRTKEERDRLKDDLLPFVLIWYKALVLENADPTESNVLAEFINKAQAAGYNYPEWEIVMRSYQAYCPFRAMTDTIPG